MSICCYIKILNTQYIVVKISKNEYFHSLSCVEMHTEAVFTTKITNGRMDRYLPLGRQSVPNLKGLMAGYSHLPGWRAVRMNSHLQRRYEFPCGPIGAAPGINPLITSANCARSFIMTSHSSRVCGSTGRIDGISTENAPALDAASMPA
jgi:hypothetical protein